MGSLIALETSGAASREGLRPQPDRTQRFATMTVAVPDLLKAAEANSPDACDMVSIWGLGFKAELGGSLAPGAVDALRRAARAAADAARRALQRPQRLQFYQNALTAAAQVKVPRMHLHSRRARHDDAAQRRQDAGGGDAERARPSCCPALPATMMVRSCRTRRWAAAGGSIPGQLAPHHEGLVGLALRACARVGRMSIARRRPIRSTSIASVRSIRVAVERADQVVDAVDLDAVEPDHDIAGQQSRLRGRTVRLDLRQQRAAIGLSTLGDHAWRRGTGAVWPATPIRRGRT